MKTSRKSDEFLIIGGRTYARLKGEEDRREYKLGWKPVAIGACSLAFCLVLVFMAKAAAAEGDTPRVQVLGWILVGFVLIAMISPIVFVIINKAKPQPLPNYLLPIPSPTHRLVAVRPSSFGVGIGAIGWLDLDGGRFKFKSKNYDFEIGSLDWEEVRMIEGYATIRLKRDSHVPDQTVKVLAIKVTTEGAVVSRSETVRLATDLKQLPNRVGKSIFPPLEVYPVPFDLYVMVRATAIGMLAGLSLMAVTMMVGPRPVPVAMAITLVAICGLLGTLFASIEPLMSGATQKTIDKWRRGE